MPVVIYGHSNKDKALSIGYAQWYCRKTSTTLYVFKPMQGDDKNLFSMIRYDKNNLFQNELFVYHNKFATLCLGLTTVSDPRNVCTLVS